MLVTEHSLQAAKRCEARKLGPYRVQGGPPPAGSELELTVPACINKYLRQYQRGGVRFLMRQYANNLGGILADVSPCLPTPCSASGSLYS